MSTALEERKPEKAVDPCAEFCSAFLLKVLKVYKEKVGDFSPTEKQKVFLEGIGAYAATGLLLLGFGPWEAGGAAVKKVADKIKVLCKEMKGMKIEKEKRQEIDPESSANFERKFRLKFLQAAVIFYNVYEFQLQHIYIETTDKKLNHILALRKIGNFLGEKTFENLTEILEGKEKATNFDENFFKRCRSKFTNWIKDEKLFFKVNSQKLKNLSQCQIFNESLPLFYEEGDSQAWMRTEDMNRFFPNCQTSFLRRPVNFEWEEFVNKLDMNNFSRISLADFGFSNYKCEQTTPQLIDELLDKLEDKYLGEETKMRAQINQTNDKVSKMENVVQETNDNVKQLLHGNNEGREVITKFNNMEKFDLMEPETAESLKNALQKADENKLPTKIEEKMIVIHGMGGVGKSSLATWCAHTHFGHKNTWWINAETPQSILSSFTELAEELQVDDSKIQRANKNGEKLARLVFNHMSTHKINDVLLIYDNANQMHTPENDGAFGISEYLPNISTSATWAPVILVTSRWAGWKTRKDQTLSLDSWNETMTIHFLKTRFNSILEMSDLCNFKEFPGSDLERSMKKLHSCLGGFPLATAIVASNITAELEVLIEEFEGEVSDLSITDQCREELVLCIQKWVDEEFKELKHQSFASGDSKNYKHTLKSVWDSTMTRLRQKEGEKTEQRKKHKLALHLLNIMAFIPTDEITLRRLYFTLYPQPLTIEVRTGFSKSAEYKDIRLAVNILEKYCLARVVRGQVDDGNGESNLLNTDLAQFFYSKGVSRVVIHRLIQQRIIDDLKEESPNMAEILCPVVEFAATYKIHYFPPELRRLADHLDQFQWPGETYKHFLTFVATDLKYYECGEMAMDSKLKEHFISLKRIFKKGQLQDPEYLALCDLALIACDLYAICNHQSSRQDSSSEIGKVDGDKHSIDKDSKILAQVLGHLENYGEIHKFFYFGVHCFRMFKTTAFTDDAKQRTILWLNAHFKRISDDPSFLPPLPYFWVLLHLAEQVGVTPEDCIGYVVQTARVLNGLDDETVAKLPAYVRLDDILHDFLIMIESYARNTTKYGTTLVRDENVKQILFKFLSETAGIYEDSSDDPKGDCSISFMDSVLNILRNLVLDKDFAASAINSPTFTKGFLNLFNSCRCSAFSLDSKLFCVNGIDLERQNVLLMGFSLFSHDILDEDSKILEIFQKFVEVAGQQSRACRMDTKPNNRCAIQKFIGDNIQKDEIQALGNFLEVHNKNEISKQAVHLANFFKKIVERNNQSRGIAWGFFNLPFFYPDVPCHECEWSYRIWTNDLYKCNVCDDFFYCLWCKKYEEHEHNDWTPFEPPSVL